MTTPLLTEIIKFEESLTKDIIEESYVDLAENFAFTGFNRSKFIKLLFDKEKDKKVLKKDIGILICFYCSRGTSVSKSLLKMSEKGQKELKDLIKKYDIKNNLSAGENQVTIGRIVASFPEPTALFFAKNPYTTRVIGDIPVGFPDYFCFPGGCAMIPKEKEEMMEKFIEWSVSFSNIIQSKEIMKRTDSDTKKEFKNEIKERAKNFAHIISSSASMSEEEKVKFLRTIEKVRKEHSETSEEKAARIKEAFDKKYDDQKKELEDQQKADEEEAARDLKNAEDSSKKIDVAETKKSDEKDVWSSTSFSDLLTNRKANFLHPFLVRLQHTLSEDELVEDFLKQVDSYNLKKNTKERVDKGFLRAINIYIVRKIQEQKAGTSEKK